MILDWLAVFFALVAVVWTVLPLFRADAWWIRAFEFPRVQLSILTMTAWVAYVAVVGWHDPGDIVVLVALSVCIAFQLVRIVPYTPLYPTQLKTAVNPKPEDSLSLLVANVLTPNRNAERFLEIVRDCDPDVVLTVETDAWWESELDALESDYPYAVKQPLDNLYGMHLYSRLELVDPQVLFLVEDDVPSIHAELVLRSGHRLELHCLHPAPPSPTENETSAERDAELLVVAKTLEALDRSVVVMGDLNDVAWSATTRLFQRLSGLLDPRIGRGMYSTFHANYPMLRWPLDHMFCSTDFTLVSIARPPYFGSDHFPMHAVFCHTPTVGAAQEQPDADREDRKWADEKIDKVNTDEEGIRAVSGPRPSTQR